ncbi:MAG: nucleoside 2-deoxyribosyltransferase [Ignavibacteriales bacterium]|nr:nucleoside 2-deoxyribosyltransferase [Ignavibacteriales bacterium]
MIIYCAGPIRGNTTYQENYSEIVRIVESTGHTALSEVSTKFSSSIPLSAKQIYTRDIKWIDGSKLLIAEVSGPSLGVGFEVAYALLVKKFQCSQFIKNKLLKFLQWLLVVVIRNCK